MRLERVLMGRAVRLMRVCGPGGGDIYGLNLARACESRYGFLQSPRTLEEFDLTRGVTFLHGYFQNRIVIDRFQIFRNGMLAEAKTNTDQSDAFLDDVLEWLGNEGSINVTEEIGSPRFYSSDLEVEGSFSIAEKLRILNKIGREISDKLREYRQTTVDYELVGLLFAAGSGTVPTFRFERRENAPEGTRLYYSAAPLQTNDHLSVLERFEAILTD